VAQPFVGLIGFLGFWRGLDGRAQQRFGVPGVLVKDDGDRASIEIISPALPKLIMEFDPFLRVVESL
jgi:hypothetical protein